MRIVCAAHNATRLGGVETYLATLVPALRAAGHEVACWFEVSAQNREPVIAPSEAIQVWSADANRASSFEQLDRWRPDVVYAHGFQSLDNERRLLETAPAVCFAHSYYGTCISGSKTHRSPATATCERRFGWQCLAHYYPRRCGGHHPLTMLRQYQVQKARLALLDSYERIVVASEHMAREYARHGAGSKVRVIPLPITNEPSTSSESRDCGVWRLLFLGRLEHSKGAAIALESAAIAAACSSKPIILQMSGEGSLRNSLRTDAARLQRRQRNLHVEITGWLHEADRRSAFDRADLLLVPSCWPEPFGLVGPEAGSRGVPAVAFANGGIPEWLTDGVNGRLVPGDPPDAARFAAAISDCLRDPEALAAMGERSRAMASAYGVDTHARRLEAVLSEAARRVSILAAP